MGADFRPQYLPARNEVQHAYSAHEKAARMFGTGPGCSLEEGIGRMSAWVKKSGARQSRSFGALDIERNLPLSWLG
jgi:UDP-glucose 4-epimerase